MFFQYQWTVSVYKNLMRETCDTRVYLGITRGTDRSTFLNRNITLLTKKFKGDKNDQFSMFSDE